MCIILALAVTVLSFFIIVLLAKANKENAKALLLSLIRSEKYKINDIENKKIMKIHELKENGVASDSKKVKNTENKYNKQIKEHADKINKLKKGKMSIPDIMPLVGYSIVGMVKLDANNSFYKKIHSMFLQTEEKSEAANNTVFTISKIISTALFGMDLFLLALTFTIGMQLGERGAIISLMVLVFTLVLAYIPYDELSEKTKFRAESIERDFANMVSKLALLVGAGMEVSKAWDIAASNGEGVLFTEMRKVTEELNNNISPVVAYGNFIDRCNSKYTTKLATSIIQNISKGNAEIVKLFKEISDESWNEKKHNARRMGEAAQGKLIVPTILLFGGILLIVMGPAMMNFSSGGMM